MTHFQELQLAICFGSAIGLYITGIATLICFAVEGHREKKRKEEAKQDAIEE